jgi:hypothetical protein
MNRQDAASVIGPRSRHQVFRPDARQQKEGPFDLKALLICTLCARTGACMLSYGQQSHHGHVNLPYTGSMSLLLMCTASTR